MKLAEPISVRGLITLAVLFLLLLVLRWALLEQMDALAFDLGLRMGGPQPPDSRIVIVAVDEGSLQQTGSWPWPPETLNRLFQRILDQDPAVLAVDILLTRPISHYPALQGEKRAVLASSLGMEHNGGQTRLFWEEPQGLGQDGPASGHIHADKDWDGICRSIPLSVTHAGERRWALALEAARIYWGLPPAATVFQGQVLRIGERSIPRLSAPLDDSLDSRGILPSLSGDHLLIHMRGGNNTFPYISAGRLLEDDAAVLQSLTGRIVMVGATAYSLGDHLSTPFSGLSEMPGVEIHANALDTVLNGRFLDTLEEHQILLLMLGCMLGAWWLFHIRTRNWALAVFALSLAAALILPILILIWASFWIPQASLAATVALTAACAQFSRFSSLNRQVNQQFAHLSQLLREISGRRLSSLIPDRSQSDLQPPASSPQPPFQSRSLEWKLGVLNQASENALRTAQVQQELVSFLSHEFKTPLASMRGFAALLQEGGSLSPKDRDTALRLIRSESDRLAKMVEDFLDLTRLEQGMAPLQPSPCPLGEILRQACSMMTPQLKEKRMNVLGLEHLPVGAVVQGDQSLLTQIFLNLLSNAVKYSPQGSSIQVEIALTRQRVRISIRDRGAGISEADQARLFEKFFRGAAEQSDLAPGSGLGLAWVHAAAEVHQGIIEVESQVGAGSKFTLDLPLIEKVQG